MIGRRHHELTDWRRHLDWYLWNMQRRKLGTATVAVTRKVRNAWRRRRIRQWLPPNGCTQNATGTRRFWMRRLASQ